MKTILNRITAFITGLLCAIISVISASAGACSFDISDSIAPEQNVSVTDRVIWYVVTQTVPAGSDVQIDIIVRNPIDLSRIENVKISVASPIQIKGMSQTCPAYGATLSPIINGNTISFDIICSDNADGGENKEVLFSLFLHVPAGCADGDYAIEWIANDTIAYEPNDQAYFPVFRDGRVIVSSSAVTTTTTNTTKSTYPLPKTTTTSVSTSTTTTTTTAAPAPTPEPVDGDANGDGKVLLSDAILILQCLGNPDEYKIQESQAEAADVYERGSGLTSMDALLIQKFLLKLVDSLPDG